MLNSSVPHWYGKFGCSTGVVLRDERRTWKKPRSFYSRWKQKKIKCVINPRLLQTLLLTTTMSDYSSSTDVSGYNLINND